MNVRAIPASSAGFAYTLSVDGISVGWVRAGAIGFGPFPSVAAARAAAHRALPALERWYAARWCCAPLSWSGHVEPRFALAHRSAVLGRIVQLADLRRSDAGECSFELRIPDVLWVATAEDLARRLAVAMRLPVGRGDALRDVGSPHVAVLEEAHVAAAGD